MGPWESPCHCQPGSGGDGGAMAAHREWLYPYKAIVWALVCQHCAEPGELQL